MFEEVIDSEIEAYRRVLSKTVKQASEFKETVDEQATVIKNQAIRLERQILVIQNQAEKIKRLKARVTYLEKILNNKLEEANCITSEKLAVRFIKVLILSANLV